MRVLPSLSALPERMCARTHAHTHTPQISQLETGADLIRKDGVKEKLLDQLEDDANAEDIRSAVLRVLCEDAFKEELRDGHLLLMRDGCVLRHLQVGEWVGEMRGAPEPVRELSYPAPAKGMPARVSVSPSSLTSGVSE
eukprot:GHVU01077391.1.p1 GENE.GHVU01077391.1~~GHVU01077391.1.p1  ORF type:complete len:139 (-),score=16.69 GHVU01077391.1:120-536(-)